MPDLVKRSLRELDSFPSAFVWPTEMNELRPLARESVERQADVLLRELKILALFHPHVLIEDPYVVNSLGLQYLVLNNTASIRSAIEGHVVLFMLRPTFGTYSEANEVVGPRRFIPARYGETAVALAEIDRYLAASKVAVRIQEPVAEYTFELVLENLIRSSALGEIEIERLASALDTARRKAVKGHVSSSDVYRELEQYSPNARARMVQACRAARVLVGPLGMRVSASVAESDVSRSFVLAAAGLSIRLDLERAESLITMYPRRILPLKGLETLTFADICVLRERTAFGDYRGALVRLRQSLENAVDDDPAGAKLAPDEAPWRGSFLAYLENLQLYLEDIGRQRGVELVPWLSHDAKMVVTNERDRRERHLLHLMRLIPICGAAWWEALSPVYGFQPLPAMIGSLASLAAEEIHRSVVARRKGTFRRLLEFHERAEASAIATRAAG